MNRRRRLHCKVTASASRRLQMETLEKRRLLAVFDVTTTDDVVDDSDGQLSLREAITAANVNGSSEVDVINIPAGTYTLTRDGADENGNSTGDLDINTPVTIRGVGQGNTTIDAGGDTGIQDRVFQTLGQHEVTFEDLTIRGGRITGSSGGGLFVSGVSDSLVTLRRVTVLDNVASAAGQGGGITVTTQGSLVIEESSVSGNSSPQAGGILNFGTLDVIASSIRGNETDNLGGGIQNGADAVARILNSTIANNNALNGGGIANFNGTLSVTQSTLSGNVASSLSGAVLTIASGTDAEATSTVFQSTIVGSTQADAGAVHVTTQSGASSATTSLGSSVFEGNSGGERDVSSSENGQLVSLGHNASEGSGFSVLTQTGDVTNISLPIVDPSLADNGGPTLTHALLPGSPAIDGGPPDALAGFDGIPEFDQRGSGFDRVFDGDGDLTPRIDIGAFEWNASSVVDFTQVVRLNEAGNQIEIEVNGLVTNLISPPIDVIEAIGGDGVDTVIIEDIGDLVSGSIPLRFDAGGGGDVVRLAGAGQVLDVTSLPEGAITGLETIDLRGTGDNTLEISRDNIVSLTGPNQILTVRVDPQDSVIVPPLSVLQPHGGFVIIDVGFLDSELTVVSRSTDDDDDPVLVFAGSDWTNPLDVNDVTGGGGVTALDALRVINELNARRFSSAENNQELVDVASLADNFPDVFSFYDVDRDGRVTAIDALRVINAINVADARLLAEPLGDLAFAGEVSAPFVSEDDDLHAFEIASESGQAAIDPGRGNSGKVAATVDTSSVVMSAASITMPMSGSAISHDPLVDAFLVDALLTRGDQAWLLPDGGQG